MTRRIVIEIECLSPGPNAVTRFDPYYSAVARIMLDDDNVLVFGLGTAATPDDASARSMRHMAETASPPNAHFCHTPLACTLTGRCEKQFGPTGTACCE